MWDRGWKVVYWPAVKIMHHVGGSSESRVIRSVFEFHKSAILYFNKHIQKYRNLLLPPIYATVSLRFIGILFLQFMTRTFSNFRRKPDVNDETVRTWLYRSCIKNEFSNDPFKELFYNKYEISKPDSAIPPARPNTYHLPD
jgi:GT2 family glycosyltransferase